MFCDLAGSTSLAAKLDAEDWRNLVNAYLDQASAAVTDFGGHVLKKLGDGLMALFGYPQAQENDAERALRAALAIQRALAELNAGNASKGAPELHARIGLDSGQVVVDATGEVFGEAPNVAARVQTAAEPGTVLITASVQRQTAGLFVVEDKGAHDLKGVTAPVALYRVVRASGGGRRGAGRALTPLVGREDELALLTRRWSRALEGEGQFIQVVGEPGIGKSRLIEEFRAKLAETPHTWVEWAASQLLQNTPLHPLAEWGRQRFGGADATDEGRLADLENTLRLVGLDPDEYAPLIAPLVDIALPDERSAKFAPEELRRRQLAAVTAWYFAGARTQPAVVVFEDLHWADPTSLDLLRSLAERGSQAPLFILATTRPEFRPPWAMRSHHGVVSLAPLDRAEVRRMVGEIASRHVLSDEMIDGVGERTGGVPLFVEEVTRLLLERDAQGGAQAIPPTLQQSLAARLDRLGDAREVAQIGAVLGRDFSYGLLRDLSSTATGVDEPRLHAALDRLTEADLLFVDGAPPAAAYRFKHALIQDAAYESLLKSRRQALHRRAAETLRSQPERAAAAPEAIAHHFTQAGLDELAIEWWGKAGDQALRRSAFQEAIAHLGKAIEMADKAGATAQQATGDSAAPSQRLTQLHVAQANALFAARGVGATETTEAFARARDSASLDRDAPERLSADYGLWAGSYSRGELSSMQAHAAAFLADVEAWPDSPEAGVAHRAQGITLHFAADYLQARQHLERALALFQPSRDDDMAFRFGQDPGVSAMALLALTLWPLGEVDRAISLIDRMQGRMADLSHVGTLAFGRMHAALFELMRGENARAAPNALELSHLARDHDLVMWRALGVFLQGCATAASGSIGGGLGDMRRGAELLCEQKVLLFDGLLKIALAEAEAAAGDLDHALAVLDEGLATADRLGHCTFEADLHRARGEILLKQNPADPASAEEAFLTAIAIAKHQGARSFRLRAALALAKLYQSTGRPAEAHGVLAPALEGFSPTSQMPEFAEAQALLAALAETDEVKAEAAHRQRLTQLHVSYGNALIAARGYGAQETTEAFAKAREAASGDKDAPGRLAADYGLWAGSYMRGKLPEMRTHAMAFLNDLEATPDSPAASVARRLAGVTCWCAGEYREARDYFEKALALFQPGRDDDMAFRFGQDPGIAAMANLAIASWPLGEVDRAMSLIDAMETRMSGVPHIGTLSFGRMHAALFELMRGDHARGAPHAIELARLARQHELPMWGAFGVFLQGWATCGSGAIGAGLDDMRQAVDSLRAQNVVLFDGFLKIALAEAEAAAGDFDRALAVLDEGLSIADRLGHRAFEAELHRARGDILLQRDPANSAPAQDAFLTAIAVAKQQGARSFELRAALGLAKLYQSTARPIEAHAVLAPALEGFAPMPEMPEIAQGRALLAALAESDDVMAAIARRGQRLRLQTAYSQAMMMTKGYAAEETKAAFARAAELAEGTHEFLERFAALQGQWAAACTRGELRSVQEPALAFLREAENTGRVEEAEIANFWLGLVAYWRGDFVEARTHYERGFAARDPNPNPKVRDGFGDDRTWASAIFAVIMWQLGEVERARELIESAARRAAEIGHIGGIADVLFWKSYLEIWRGDPLATLRAAEALETVARKHGLAQWLSEAELHLSWARARINDPMGGAAQVRQVLTAFVDQDIRVNLGFYTGLLAQLEAETLGPESALARVDEAFRLSNQVEHRCSLPFLHRLRGEILLKRDPADPGPAEDAYLAAIAIAKEQGARSPVLLASLALAKLYQSTGRPLEAHGVLAPALEGFAPTPEMPEIVEAQALFERLANAEGTKES